MKKIKCNRCEKSYITSAEINECIFCSDNDLEFIEQNVSETNNISLSQLMLTYNKTGQYILVPRGKKMFLGREGYAKETLLDQHISGLHCSIEVKENEITLEDLGSTNGTFYKKYGEEYRLIKKTEIDDDEILFLGRESFLLNFVYEENVLIKESEKVADLLENLSYKCKVCGYETIQELEICPDCGTKFSGK